MNLFVVEGQCYTFGTNQFGQLGNQTNNSRQPQEVKIAQTQKVAMVACGDTFTVIVADGNNWFQNFFMYGYLKQFFSIIILFLYKVFKRLLEYFLKLSLQKEKCTPLETSQGGVLDDLRKIQLSLGKSPSWGRIPLWWSPCPVVMATHS